MDVASRRITDKLWLGALPAEAPVRMWAGSGSGLACDGCEEMITASQPEHEVEMPDGHTLRFHVACAGVWGVLRQSLPDAPVGEPAVPPSEG